MARVRRNYPTNGGYAHREHRAKKGQCKFVVSESKGATYNKTQQEDIDRIEKEIAIDKALRFDTLLKEAEGRPVAYKRPKDISRPILVCFNCGTRNKLIFDPRKGGEWALSSVICKSCGKFAYFAHYCTIRFLTLWGSSIYSFCRDLIKEKKATLLNLI